MNRRQMEFILRRNRVARVAFLRDGRIELQPIHYVFSEGSIYGRTSYGAKFMAWLNAPSVVFEVDESDSLYDWRSVIGRGRVSLLDARHGVEAASEYSKAVIALRQLDRETLTDADHTPQRTAVFRIMLMELSGREAVAR